jgi:hypothetical protein
MSPVILFRSDRAFDDRGLRVAVDSGLPVDTSRTAVLPGSLVVGRDSVLPYYPGLEADLRYSGSRQINGPDQHRFVADIREYVVSPAGDLTLPAWDRASYLRDGYAGPVVLKGATNSPEGIWGMHGDTANREEMIRVRLRRRDDELIGRPGPIPLRYEFRAETPARSAIRRPSASPGLGPVGLDGEQGGAAGTLMFLLQRSGGRASPILEVEEGDPRPFLRVSIGGRVGEVAHGEALDR